MKKLLLFFLSMIIIAGACDNNSKTNSEKDIDKKADQAINNIFLDDVKQFQEDIRDAMDDMVLNNHFEDLGSLSEEEYKIKIGNLFDKWKPGDLKGNQADIMLACNSLVMDYLNYGKQSLLGDTEKADYALDNFKSDMDKLDRLLNQ